MYFAQFLLSHLCLINARLPSYFKAFRFHCGTIIHNGEHIKQWWICRSGLCPRNTPRVHWWLIQEVKEPRTPSWPPQASIGLGKVSLDDSALRKMEGKIGDGGTVPRWKPLLTIRSIQVGSKKHLNESQDIMTGVKLKIILTQTPLKHGGDSMVIWACFASSGLGQCAIKCWINLN